MPRPLPSDLDPIGPADPDDDRSPADPAAAPADDLERKQKKKKKKKKKKKDQLGSSRGIETMFRTSYMTHVNLSALADSKANIMISINGIIMSIILASISPKIDTNPWLLMPTMILLIGCLVSIVYAVQAARPRVNNRGVTLADVRRRKANILFFGNFVHLQEDDFVEGMLDLMRNTDGLYHNMVRDIYGLGQVLSRKFELLRISYLVFMIALVSGVLAFIAVYALVVTTSLGTPVMPSAPLPVPGG